jgi:hypothetical protein
MRDCKSSWIQFKKQIELVAIQEEDKDIFISI